MGKTEVPRNDDQRGIGSGSRPLAETDRGSDEELEALPYAGEFELPRERVWLTRVRDQERAGKKFVVLKSINGRTGFKQIAQLDYFPTTDEMEELFYERFGGGSYSIRAGHGGRWLHNFFLEGPSKWPVVYTRGGESTIDGLTSRQ